jgi:hypothetical protein
MGVWVGESKYLGAVLYSGRGVAAERVKCGRVDGWRKGKTESMDVLGLGSCWAEAG